MHKMFTSGIRGPISYYFHLEQDDIILLGMRILIQSFGLREEDRKNFGLRGEG